MIKVFTIIADLVLIGFAGYFVYEFSVEMKELVELTGALLEKK